MGLLHTDTGYGHAPPPDPLTLGTPKGMVDTRIVNKYSLRLGKSFTPPLGQSVRPNALVAPPDRWLEECCYSVNDTRATTGVYKAHTQKSIGPAAEPVGPAPLPPPRLGMG